MIPPPIRYPLPTIIALILLGLAAWKGEAWSRPLRADIARRWQRAIEGQPVPNSPTPKHDVGPFGPRVLLLRDETPAYGRPDGRPVETIHKRMLADVYDVWPLQGAPTHYRVGNRRPIGWVPADAVIPWGTRLVLRTDKVPNLARASAGTATSAVLSWDDNSCRVVFWESAAGWSRLERIAAIPMPSIPAEAWGVLLSRDELLALIQETLTPVDSAPPAVRRLNLIAGKAADDASWPVAEIDAARAYLPRPARAIGPRPQAERLDRLTRLDNPWTPDASWSGLSFRFVPLDLLP